MNTLPEIMTALAGVLATVPGLSTATVAPNDWRLQNQPCSAIIFPSLGGEQRALAAEDCYQQLHRITIKLTVRHQNELALYTISDAMVSLILAALREHDTLDLAEVVTCHMAGAPVTWQAPTGHSIIQDGGVLSREIDFTVTVWTT